MGKDDYARVGDPKYLSGYIKPEELIIIGDVAIIGGPTKLEIVDIMQGLVVPFYRINDNVINPTKYNTAVTIDVVFSRQLVELKNLTLSKLLDQDALKNFPNLNYLYVDFNHFYSLLKLFPIVPVYGERLNELVSGSWYDNGVRMYLIDVVQVNTLPNTLGLLQVKLIMSPTLLSYDQRDLATVMYRDGYNDSTGLKLRSYFFESADIRNLIIEDVGNRFAAVDEIVKKKDKQLSVQLDTMAKSMKMIFDIDYIIGTIYMQMKWQLGLDFGGNDTAKQLLMHYSQVDISLMNDPYARSGLIDQLVEYSKRITLLINDYIKNKVNETGAKVDNVVDLFTLDLTDNRSVQITGVQVQYDNQIVGFNTHLDRTIRQYMGSSRERGVINFIVLNDLQGREFIDTIQSFRNLSLSIINLLQGFVNLLPLLVTGILNLFGITNIYITNFAVSTLDDYPNLFSCMMQFVSTSGIVLHSELREINKQYAAFKNQLMSLLMKLIQNNSKVSFYLFNSLAWLYDTSGLFDSNGNLSELKILQINSLSHNILMSNTSDYAKKIVANYTAAASIIRTTVKSDLLQSVAKTSATELKSELEAFASKLIDNYKAYILDHYLLTAIYFDYMIHYKAFTSLLMTLLLLLYLHLNLLAKDSKVQKSDLEVLSYMNFIIETLIRGGNSDLSDSDKKKLDDAMGFVNNIISIIQEKYIDRNLRHFYASLVSGIRMLFYYLSITKTTDTKKPQTHYTLSYGPLGILTDLYKLLDALYNITDLKKLFDYNYYTFGFPTFGFPTYAPTPDSQEYLQTYQSTDAATLSAMMTKELSDSLKEGYAYNLQLLYIVGLFYINGGLFLSNIDQLLVTENLFTLSLIERYSDTLFTDKLKNMWIMKASSGNSTKDVRLKDFMYSHLKFKTGDYSELVGMLGNNNLPKLTKASFKNARVVSIRSVDPNEDLLRSPKFNKMVLLNSVVDMYKLSESFGFDIIDINNDLNRFVVNYMNLNTWLGDGLLSPVSWLYSYIYGLKGLVNSAGTKLLSLLLSTNTDLKYDTNVRKMIEIAVNMLFYNLESDSIVDLAGGPKFGLLGRSIFGDLNKLANDILHLFELYLISSNSAEFLSLLNTERTIAAGGGLLSTNFMMQTSLFQWLVEQGNDGKLLIYLFCTNFSSIYYLITDLLYNNNLLRIDLLRHYSLLDDLFNYMHDMLLFVDLLELNFINTFSMLLIKSGYLSPWEMNYRLPTEPRDLRSKGKSIGLFDDVYLQSEDLTYNASVLKFVQQYTSALLQNVFQYTSRASDSAQLLNDLFTIKSTLLSLLNTGDSSTGSIYNMMEEIQNTYKGFTINLYDGSLSINFGFNKQLSNTPFVPNDESIRQMLSDPMYRQEIMQLLNLNDPTVDDSLTKFEFNNLMENYMKLVANSNYITRLNDIFLNSLLSLSFVDAENANKLTGRKNLLLQEWDQQIYMQAYVLKRLLEDTTRRISMLPQLCIVFNLKRGSSTNFEYKQYVYHSVEDVAVIRELDNPVDSLVVKLYSTLDYSGERFVDNNYISVGLNTGELPIALLLKPGVDIEIRIGYSKNVQELTKVFVGYIRDVQMENGQLEFIALGYGLLLAKPIYKKPELYTGFFNTPKDRVVDLIKRVGLPELGMTQALDVSEKLFLYMMPKIDEAAYIRSSFSWILFRQYLPAYDNIYTPSDYYTTMQTGAKSFWSVPDSYFLNFEHHFEHYTAELGYSAWDVIEDLLLVSPDYICLVEPLEDVAASLRVFFGKAHYPFKYYYFDLSDGGVNTNNLLLYSLNTSILLSEGGSNLMDDLGLYLSPLKYESGTFVGVKDTGEFSSSILMIDKLVPFTKSLPYTGDAFVERPEVSTLDIVRGNILPLLLYNLYILQNLNAAFGIGNKCVTTNSVQSLLLYTLQLSVTDIEKYTLKRFKMNEVASFVFMPHNLNIRDWSALYNSTNYSNGLYVSPYIGLDSKVSLEQLGMLNYVKHLIFNSLLSFDKNNQVINIFSDVLQIEVWDKGGKTCNLQIGFAFIDKDIYAGPPIVIHLSSKYRKYLVLMSDTHVYLSDRNSDGVGTKLQAVMMAHGILLQLYAESVSSNPNKPDVLQFKISHIWQDGNLSGRLVTDGGIVKSGDDAYKLKYNMKFPVDATLYDELTDDTLVYVDLPSGGSYLYKDIRDTNWFSLRYEQLASGPIAGLYDFTLHLYNLNSFSVQVPGEYASVFGYFTSDFQNLIDSVFNTRSSQSGNLIIYSKLFKRIDGLDKKLDRLRQNLGIESYNFSTMSEIKNHFLNQLKPGIRFYGRGKLTFGYELRNNTGTANMKVTNIMRTGGELRIGQFIDHEADPTKSSKYIDASINLYPVDLEPNLLGSYLDKIYQQFLTTFKAPVDERQLFVYLYGIWLLYLQAYMNKIRGCTSSLGTLKQSILYINPFDYHSWTIELIHTIYLADILDFVAGKTDSEKRLILNKFAQGEWQFADKLQIGGIWDTYSTGITSSRKITGCYDKLNCIIGSSGKDVIYKNIIDKYNAVYSNLINLINSSFLGSPLPDLYEVRKQSDIISANLKYAQLIWLYYFGGLLLDDKSGLLLEFNLLGAIRGLLKTLTSAQQVEMLNSINQFVNLKSTLRSKLINHMTQYYTKLHNWLWSYSDETIVTETKNLLKLTRTLWYITSFDPDLHLGEGGVNYDDSLFTTYYLLKSFLMPKLGNPVHVKYLLNNFTDLPANVGVYTLGGVTQQVPDLLYNSNSSYLWRTWLAHTQDSLYPNVLPIHMLRFSKKLYSDGVLNINFRMSVLNVNLLGKSEPGLISFSSVQSNIVSKLPSDSAMLTKLFEVNNQSTFDRLVDDSELVDDPLSTSGWTTNDYKQNYLNYAKSNPKYNISASQLNDSRFKTFKEIFNKDGQAIGKLILKLYIDSGVTDDLLYIVNMTNSVIVDLFPQLYRNGFGFDLQSTFDLDLIKLQPFAGNGLKPIWFEYLSNGVKDIINKKFTDYLVTSDISDLHYAVRISNLVRKNYLNPLLLLAPDILTDFLFLLSGIEFFIPLLLIEQIVDNKDNPKLSSSVYNWLLSLYKYLDLYLRLLRNNIYGMHRLYRSIQSKPISNQFVDYLYLRMAFINLILNFLSQLVIAQVELYMPRDEMDKFIKNLLTIKHKLNRDGLSTNIFNMVSVTTVQLNIDLLIANQKIADTSRGILFLRIIDNKLTWVDKYIANVVNPTYNKQEIKFLSWYPYWDDIFGFSICLGGPLPNTGVNYNELLNSFASFSSTYIYNLLNLAKMLPLSGQLYETTDNYRFNAVNSMMNNIFDSFNLGA